MDMSKGKMEAPAEGGGDKMKDAKLAVLKHIHKMASDAMGHDYMGGEDAPAKAMVAADSPAGLKEGLAKAAELVGKEGEPLDSDEMDGEEEMSSPDHAGEGPEDASKPKASDMLGAQIDHEASEGDLSDDELDSLIAELQARKRGK